ncbi:MAG: hypothetical protein R2837_09690 [Aliarcobacter sp.]
MAKANLETFQNNIVRHISPLVATPDCRICHTNANVGDVLGILEVKQNLNVLFRIKISIYNIFNHYSYFCYLHLYLQDIQQK